MLRYIFTLLSVLLLSVATLSAKDVQWGKEDFSDAELLVTFSNAYHYFLNDYCIKLYVYGTNSAYNSQQAYVVTKQKVPALSKIKYDAYLTGGYTAIYHRVQYSVDGVNWTDIVRTKLSANEKWELGKEVILSTPVDAYVRFITDVSNLSTTYHLWLDNITFYSSTADYTRALNGNIGTICLPRDVAEGDYSGATFYEPVYVEWVDGQPYQIYFDEVTSLEAGRGYVFEPLPDAANLEVNYSGSTVSSALAADSEHPMQGTLVAIAAAASNPLVGNYIISNNQFCTAGSWVQMSANRAYIVANLLSSQGESSPAPGRRRIVMGAQGTEVATSVAQQSAPVSECRKVMVDGRLCLVRDGRVYSIVGQVVK